jgi:hypothetical protein
MLYANGGAGIPFSEAAEWIGAGLSAAEAAEQRAKGVTVEQAASFRALRIDGSESMRQDPMPQSLLARMGPPRAQAFGPPSRDKEAARKAVEDAYANMMKADDTGNVPAVEGGSNLGRCLLEARDRHNVRVSDNAPGATVKVDMVRFVNDHEARVQFTIKIGRPVNRVSGVESGGLRRSTGNGRWRGRPSVSSCRWQECSVLPGPNERP